MVEAKKNERAAYASILHWNVYSKQYIIKITITNKTALEGKQYRRYQGSGFEDLADEQGFFDRNVKVPQYV